MFMLRAIRRANRLTMKELGEAVGVSESAISQYETGKREADYQTLLRIANYFNVSTDYLLGNERHLNQDKYSALFRQNLSLALEAIDSDAFCGVEDAEYDYRMLLELSESTYPLSLKEAFEASDTISESLDDLLREDYEEYVQNKEPTPVSGDGLDDMEKLLMRYVKDLTEDQKQMLLDLMQVMIGSQKKSPVASGQESKDGMLPES